MMNSHLLEVKNLKTVFNTEDGTVYAVNDISYYLDEGETLAIVGESGSGKSVGVYSLLRLIPSPPGDIVNGEVIFNKRDLLKLKQRELEDIRGKEIGLIFQDPTMSLTPVIPVSQQITEILIRHKGMSKSEARKRGIELMEMVHIPQAAARFDNYPHEFSGGVRQRIMIAMAIACMPKMIIADEPTTALDVTIAAGIVDLVKDIQQEIGMAVIWITHDLAVVAGLADRVMVMYAGNIIEIGPVKPIYKSPKHPYTEGLLNSVPRLDKLASGHLDTIGGMPPDLIDFVPDYCPFAPRCEYAVEKCWEQKPPLMAVAPQQMSACWRPEAVGNEGIYDE